MVLCVKKISAESGRDAFDWRVSSQMQGECGTRPMLE
jgi:hypothetical protein